MVVVWICFFPHHECEIAQSNAITGHDPAKYWMHNNMITVNGQKMGKSLNNFITLDEFFTGDHDALDQAYSPMTVRFFMLQAHYRSTLDFSNEALKAAEKGIDRLFDAYNLIGQLNSSDHSTTDVKQFEKLCAEAINDDFNTPIVLAHLFDLSKVINSINDGKVFLTVDDITFVKQLFDDYLFGILGLKQEIISEDNSYLVDGLMETIIKLRQEAKNAKDYATADKIRDELAKLNILIKDTKEGAKWEIN